MMFGGFGEDQPEPTEAEVGIFLPESELLEWHRKMQARYPTIFTPEDKLFGDDGKQHALGTKLMAYFDDDPNKPMRVEVMGSRWKIEFQDRSPVYIVRFKGNAELSQVELTSAHEEAGWKVGWDVPPPSG